LSIWLASSVFPTSTLSPLGPGAHAGLLAEYNRAAHPKSRTGF
jgi:hypothetical protein